jgi:hypothetical protein
MDRQEAIDRVAPHALALTQGTAWNEVVKFLEFENEGFANAVLELNPFGDTFAQDFYVFQREIWARVRAKEIIEGLAQAQRDAQETDNG